MLEMGKIGFTLAPVGSICYDEGVHVDKISGRQNENGRL